MSLEEAEKVLQVAHGADFDTILNAKEKLLGAAGKDEERKFQVRDVVRGVAEHLIQDIACSVQVRWLIHATNAFVLYGCRCHTYEVQPTLNFVPFHAHVCELGRAALDTPSHTSGADLHAAPKARLAIIT